jgi:hypothetical protein
MTTAQYTADNKTWDVLKGRKQPDRFGSSLCAQSTCLREAGEKGSFPSSLPSTPHHNEKRSSATNYIIRHQSVPSKADGLLTKVVVDPQIKLNDTTLLLRTISNVSLHECATKVEERCLNFLSPMSTLPRTKRNSSACRGGQKIVQFI